MAEIDGQVDRPEGWTDRDLENVSELFRLLVKLKRRVRERRAAKAKQ